MNDVGITRIQIIDQPSGRGGWRFRFSRDHWPAANRLYRRIFDGLGMPLLPDNRIIKCSRDEFMSGYDHELGIDVIFNFESGMKLTLQEKFLSYDLKTVTVEYMQDWRRGIKGDWFNMLTQLYFTGYDRTDALDFQDWILLNWPAVLQATAQGLIPWRQRPNRHDGARANFKYAPFEDFPSECIVACSDSRQLELFDKRGSVSPSPG